MAETRYEQAKKIYASIGVDTEKAINELITSPYPCTVGREMT